MPEVRVHKVGGGILKRGLVMLCIIGALAFSAAASVHEGMYEVAAGIMVAMAILASMLVFGSVERWPNTWVTGGDGEDVHGV